MGILRRFPIRFRRRAMVRTAVFALATALASSSVAGTQDQKFDEYRVKAAFLYNFAKFIEWPPEVFLNPNDPFVICVLGQDPFGHALDDAVAGKKIEGRAFAIRRIASTRQATACRILFVSSSEPKHVLTALAAMKEPGVLTVGESDSPTAEGMIINLTLQGGKVRFEINMDSGSGEKLRFSSKLLSLATVLKK